MLGTFRFVLAWFVMLSHLPFSMMPHIFNFGVSSVILFYFISGYLMHFSFLRVKQKFSSFSSQIVIFYFKRVLRLFPLYLIVLFLTLSALKIWGNSSLIPLLNQELSLQKIVYNSLLLFNNYVFPPFMIKELLPHPLIPPTWSLSTEWHFYLLVPILFYWIRERRWLFYLILTISILIEWSAFAIYTEWFNSDNFGYRYIPGVLWIFMLGFLYATKDKIFWLYYILITFFTLFISIFFYDKIFVKEITFSYLLLPLIRPLLRISFKYDKLFGQLSYPLFLVHFLIFYIVEKSIGTSNKTLYIISVFISVLLAASLLAYIEKYFYKLHSKLYP